jgi:hypothetical protein
MNFLTPQFFDFLVILSAVIGLVFAARRLYQDLRGGPRYHAIGDEQPPQQEP